MILPAKARYQLRRNCLPDFSHDFAVRVDNFAASGTDFAPVYPQGQKNNRTSLGRAADV